MTRGRVLYSVGIVTNAGNPFGRSELAIEPDGAARLVHYPRGGGPGQTWTARVAAAALDALWSGLERAGFPRVPQHAIPGGSTMRHLGVEAPGAAKQTASIEW